MAAAVHAIRKKNKELAREQVLEVFDKYDADGSGAIDREELTSALEDLGMKVTASQAGRVLRKFGGKDAEELNKEQFEALVHDLQEMQSDVKQRGGAGASAACGAVASRLPVWKGHERALVFYTNRWVQMFVAAMILGNFFVNIIEKEIDPFPGEMQLYKRYWDDFDTAFNIIFRECRPLESDSPSPGVVRSMRTVFLTLLLSHTHSRTHTMHCPPAQSSRSYSTLGAAEGPIRSSGRADGTSSISSSSPSASP